MSHGAFPITPIELDTLIERACTRLVKGQHAGQGLVTDQPAAVLMAFQRSPQLVTRLINPHFPYLALNIGTTWRSCPEITVVRFGAKRMAGNVEEYEPDTERTRSIFTWNMRSRTGRNVVNMLQRGFTRMIQEGPKAKEQSVYELHTDERQKAITTKFKNERTRLLRHLRAKGLQCDWVGSSGTELAFFLPFVPGTMLTMHLELGISTSTGQDPLKIDIGECIASFGVSKVQIQSSTNRYGSTFNGKWSDMCQFVERFITTLQQPLS